MMLAYRLRARVRRSEGALGRFLRGLPLMLWLTPSPGGGGGGGGAAPRACEMRPA
jgi:hypothetical protein